ncbi:hypothetical protein QO021_28395 (plasmid) [Pseudomonas amygdali pv. lachrymans]|uniref:hypothetical protein n=1 Tax=Pseudomonas amygdali TaxID=47877 RepID=UPI0006B9BE23|nr:hypothetical protein [Pseudomonas amygdali]RMM39506.1 hypothetical protein ALQ79_200296 [Pseudomonas amygdali pv. lachrymans]WIO61479.1 hypothetical protein QO021_28395 [Pseudomonas amygdali pv. lachrymans]
MQIELDEERRTRTGVVVSATHPTLGPLYWEFVSERSVGGPDYYSISTSMARALLLVPGWRETTQSSYYGGHLSQVIRNQAREYRDPEYWGVDLVVELEDGLASLQAKSNQNEIEFLAWLRAAEWIDVPGPTVVEELVDHGFMQEWEVVSFNPPTSIQVLA